MPEYCPTKKKTCRILETNYTKVKAENQVGIISISSISGCDEAKLQNYKVGHQNNCKQK